MTSLLAPFFFALVGAYATHRACRLALKRKQPLTWQMAFWGAAAPLIAIPAFIALLLVLLWNEPNAWTCVRLPPGLCLPPLPCGLFAGALVVGYYRQRLRTRLPDAASIAPPTVPLLESRTGTNPGTGSPGLESTDPGSSIEYFYAVRSKQHGPVSFYRLRSLAMEGELRRTDRIWRRGMAAWQPAATLAAVFDKLPPDLPEATTEPTPPPLGDLREGLGEGSDQDRPQTPLFKPDRAAVITAFPIGLLFACLSASMREPSWRDSEFNFGAALCSVLSFAFLGIALFKWMQLHYRLWKMVPPSIASTTPARAVAFYFIPLLNVVWMFVTFSALAKDANRTLDKFGCRARRCNEALAVIFATVQAAQCSLGVLFPSLGLILMVVGFALWIPVYGELCRVFQHVNTNVGEKQSREPSGKGPTEKLPAFSE